MLRGLTCSPSHLGDNQRGSLAHGHARSVRDGGITVSISLTIQEKTSWRPS